MAVLAEYVPISTNPEPIRHHDPDGFWGVYILNPDRQIGPILVFDEATWQARAVNATLNGELPDTYNRAKIYRLLAEHPGIQDAVFRQTAISLPRRLLGALIPQKCWLDVQTGETRDTFTVRFAKNREGSNPPLTAYNRNDISETTMADREQLHTTIGVDSPTNSEGLKREPDGSLAPFISGQKQQRPQTPVMASVLVRQSIDSHDPIVLADDERDADAIRAERMAGLRAYGEHLQNRFNRHNWVEKATAAFQIVTRYPQLPAPREKEIPVTLPETRTIPVRSDEYWQLVRHLGLSDNSTWDVEELRERARQFQDIYVLASQIEDMSTLSKAIHKQRGIDISTEDREVALQLLARGANTPERYAHTRSGLETLIISQQPHPDTTLPAPEVVLVADTTTSTKPLERRVLRIKQDEPAESVNPHSEVVSFNRLKKVAEAWNAYQQLHPEVSTPQELARLSLPDAVRHANQLILAIATKFNLDLHTALRLIDLEEAQLLKATLIPGSTVLKRHGKQEDFLNSRAGLSEIEANIARMQARANFRDNAAPVSLAEAAGDAFMWAWILAQTGESLTIETSLSPRAHDVARVFALVTQVPAIVNRNLTCMNLPTHPSEEGKALLEQYKGVLPWIKGIIDKVVGPGVFDRRDSYIKDHVAQLQTQPGYHLLFAHSQEMQAVAGQPELRTKEGGTVTANPGQETAPVSKNGIFSDEELPITVHRERAAREKLHHFSSLIGQEVSQQETAETSRLLATGIVTQLLIPTINELRWQINSKDHTPARRISRIIPNLSVGWGNIVVANLPVAQSLTYQFRDEKGSVMKPSEIIDIIAEYSPRQLETFTVRALYALLHTASPTLSLSPEIASRLVKIFPSFRQAAGVLGGDSNGKYAFVKDASGAIIDIQYIPSQITQPIPQRRIATKLVAQAVGPGSLHGYATSRGRSIPFA